MVLIARRWCSWPSLGRQPALERDAQAGAVERLLDVVRGQGVAGEEDVQVAGADQPADVLAAAGVDDRRAEHREDLLAGLRACAASPRRSRGRSRPWASRWRPGWP